MIHSRIHTTIQTIYQAHPKSELAENDDTLKIVLMISMIPQIHDTYLIEKYTLAF